MEEEYFRKIVTTVIILSLVVLAFFIIKPIIMSIILGLLLAFIFLPLYNFIYKYTKMENLSSMIVCFLLAIIIIVPLWLLTPLLIESSFNFFVSVQQIDIITPLKEFFPSFFSSQQFSTQVASIVSSFITKSANFLMNEFSNILLDLPNLALQLVVVLFTFYFVLRDKEKLIEYIKSILPFSKEVEKKLFDYTKGITYSVLYGQIIIGIIQGLIVGASLFIFKVPNALILTLLAVGLSIFPILGPYFMWVPVAIYLVIAGNKFAAIGVIIFGIVASTIDNLFRPLIVSKRVDLPSSIILIGMIGGLFIFGILGFVIGPLILAYLLVVLEIYRNKKLSGVLIEPEKEKK